MNGIGLVRPVGAIMATLSGLVLAACQTSVSVTEPPSHAQTAVVAGANPPEVYSLIAGKVKSCWLNPADPVLTKHVFHAVADADGSTTNIVIHERAPDGRRGLKAYRISFVARGRDTKVVTENQRLPYALSQKLSADVGRWVQGSTLCEIGETRGSAPIPRGGVRPRRGL